MTPFDYIGQAVCTKSDKFFGERIGRDEFLRVIGSAIVALQQLDVLKKALFYGRSYPEHQAASGTCEGIAQNWIDAKEPKKIIFVPDKLINIVI